MKPSSNLESVINFIAALPNHGGKINLEDLNLAYLEVAHDDLKLSQKEINDLSVEMSDLQATYGPEANAVAIVKGEVKELDLWAKLKDGGHCKIVHAINYDDKAFSDNSFVIGLPAGNFSVEYLVYADNAQDALDALADYEVFRRQANPDIRIFMVDTYSASAEELEEMQALEDAGEYMRLGNDGNLFDISTISIKPANALSIEAGLDIDEHLKKTRRHESPSPGF
ncbi:MAG: hypothetical protein RSG77_25595 [Hafnia sp.]